MATQPGRERVIAFAFVRSQTGRRFLLVITNRGVILRAIDRGFISNLDVATQTAKNPILIMVLSIIRTIAFEIHVLFKQRRDAPTVQDGPEWQAAALAEAITWDGETGYRFTVPFEDLPKHYRYVVIGGGVPFIRPSIMFARRSITSALSFGILHSRFFYMQRADAQELIALATRHSALIRRLEWRLKPVPLVGSLEIHVPSAGVANISRTKNVINWTRALAFTALVAVVASLSAYGKIRRFAESVDHGLKASREASDCAALLDTIPAFAKYIKSARCHSDGFGLGEETATLSMRPDDWAQLSSKQLTELRKALESRFSDITSVGVFHSHVEIRPIES